MSINVQYHPPRLSEDRLNLPQPHSPSLPTHCSGKSGMRPFLTFDRESEQYLCAALLRHGKAVASEGTVGLLSRLLPRLRRAFPRARILVRLDGGFASPAVFAFLEAQPRLDYVIAMAKNAVLERYAEPAMLVARARTWRSEQTEHVYTETNEYQAGTWNHARRVVIKAEVVRHRDREPRDNPHFVVTNMRQTPRFLYEKVYCARGDAENRIKELKALQIDRTSCGHNSCVPELGCRSARIVWIQGCSRSDSSPFFPPRRQPTV